MMMSPLVYSDLTERVPLKDNILVIYLLSQTCENIIKIIDYGKLKNKELMTKRTNSVHKGKCFFCNIYN